MLAVMQEDDGLIWAMYGTMARRKRVRLLRSLRRQYRADLTDARAEVIARRQRPALIDNTLQTICLVISRSGNVDLLETDIAWHREQLRLARKALEQADTPFNPTRAIEVEALRAAVKRFERTLADLEKLSAKGT